MTRMFDIHRALSISTAQTTDGHRVTGLQERCDPVTHRHYLLGWSWQPDHNGYGCTGPQRWNVDGTSLDDRFSMGLTDFESDPV